MLVMRNILLVDTPNLEMEYRSGLHFFYKHNHLWLTIYQA